MNIISKAARRGHQLRIRLVLVLFSLILGTQGCNLFAPVTIDCEDIPVTVAPGTCTFFPPPPCFGDSSREPTFILPFVTNYSVMGDEQIGFQFCASEDAADTSGTVRVAYMLTQGGRQSGRGDFLVTVRSVDVTVSDSPDPVSVGSDLTYTITLTNHRPVSISSLVFSDFLPANVTFVSGLAADCSLDEDIDEIICRNIEIAAGASVTYQFVVRPTTPGTITNTLDLVSPTVTVTNITTVVPASGADLSVAITDSPDPVIRGATVTYTVTVTNNGPSAATGVRLSDLLPPLEVFNIVVSQGSFTRTNPSEIICDFGTLASGASATLIVTGATFTSGTITNTATATATEVDPNTTNNTASENTTVNPP